jgi:hypothetical protein
MGSHRSKAASGCACWSVHLLACASIALLAGCPTVDLGDTPSDIGLCNPPKGIEYFRTEVWPKFVRPTDTTNGCTKVGGCHNEAGGNALGFRGGANPTTTEFTFNYRQTQIYLNCGNPEASPLLTKPLSSMDPHGGGNLIPPGSEPETVFLLWFEE